MNAVDRVSFLKAVMSNTAKQVKMAALILILVPANLILLRYNANRYDAKPWEEVAKHKVEYRFDLIGNDNYTISSFLPGNDLRQKVKCTQTADVATKTFFQGDNQRVEWKGNVQGQKDLRLTLECITKRLQYVIDPNLAWESKAPFAEETALIEHENEQIQKVARELTDGQEFLKGAVNSLYEFVYQIPGKKTSELTSALATLNNNEASCNGKSRLLVALCRSLGLEARMVGGLLLEEAEKRTSHAWVEVRMGNKWVPFDAYNGHFASLPAKYLKIYEGDHFLITRKGDVNFDYQYVIEPQSIGGYNRFALLNVRTLAMTLGLPIGLLRTLLMLPLGALLVAIFKNVIGLKSYGVFLPVLMALSFVETGLLAGLLLFTGMMLVISLLSKPLNVFGIQHTPKVVIMLTAVVLTSLVSMQLLGLLGEDKGQMAMFFPIIVLTLTAEKFAQKAEEEGVKYAGTIYLQTLLVTALCFIVVSSKGMLEFIVTFPETLLAVAGIAMILGRWIGLRLLEFGRFNIQPG